MRDHRAFSLLEMLVVIAIIAILISMLLPSLRRSVKMTRTTVCMSHLREVSHSLQVYRIEHEGHLPDVQPYGGQDASSGAGIEDVSPWFLRLYPSYMSDLSNLVCPEDPYKFRMVRAKDDPLKEPEIGEYSSYGMNSFIMTAGDGYLRNLDRYAPTRPVDTMLVADSGPDEPYSIPRSEPIPPNEGPKRNKSLLAYNDGFNPLSAEVAAPWITRRHGNRINVLSLTGSVRQVVTDHIIHKPIRSHYDSCEAGGCTFCRYLLEDHYSFALKGDAMFWWTGPVPKQ